MTSVAEVMEVLGPDGDTLDQALHDISLVVQVNACTLDDVRRYGKAVRAYFLEDMDTEDEDAIAELLYNSVAEMVLAAHVEGWGGEMMEDLYDYYDIVTMLNGSE